MGISFWKSCLFFLVVVILGIILFPSPRMMGLFYAQSRRLTQARYYLEQHYQLDPQDLPNTVRYLQTLITSGDFVLFEQVGQKALAIYPNELSVHRVMADFYEGQFQYDQASAHWEKMLLLDPKLKDIPEKLLSYYIFEKNYPALIRIYELAIQQKQDSPDLYYDLARLYALQKQFKQAETIYTQLLEKFPHEAEAKLKLADMYEYTKQEEQALALYKKISQEQRDNVQYAKLFLEKLIEYKKEIEAMQLFHVYKKQFSRSDAFLIFLADVYLDFNQRQEASALLETIAQHPYRKSYLDKLGELYYKVKEYEKASDLLRSYHDQTTGDYHSHHVLGDVYAALGDQEGSRREYEKALQLIRQ